jgi:hypothetical protein
MVGSDNSVAGYSGPGSLTRVNTVSVPDGLDGCLFSANYRGNVNWHVVSRKAGALPLSPSPVLGASFEDAVYFGFSI